MAFVMPVVAALASGELSTFAVSVSFLPVAVGTTPRFRHLQMGNPYCVNIRKVIETRMTGTGVGAAGDVKR